MKPEILRTCPLPTMILAGTAWLVSRSLAAADEENGRSLRDRLEIERTFEPKIESQRNRDLDDATSDALSAVGPEIAVETGIEVAF
jgi:hypothetical protein